jgi:hypothetical protein
VKDPQARHLSNPEVATKTLARIEHPLFKHRTNCSRTIIRQGSSEPRVVKQIHSSLVKASPPLLHFQSSENFWAIQRFKFGVDRHGLQPFEHEETNHRLPKVLFCSNDRR